MSRDELIRILLDECGGDFEASHDNADKALLAYINDPEITAAFNSQPRYTSVNQPSRFKVGDRVGAKKPTLAVSGVYRSGN